MRERTLLSTKLDSFTKLLNEKESLAELLTLAAAENETAVIAEAERSLQTLQENVGSAKIQSLMRHEADPNNCYLQVNAGAGGTESCDWAAMLLRMYSRWAERRGFGVELLDESAGEQTGYKSATIQITGAYAYGWLKTESGVHRLVRISPFDANARRHTSFSSVWVTPEVDDTIVIDIQEKDLRVDTYRSSGAGGQHVNKTDSAVRLTHLPTGVVVACQQDRSQHRNRATAMKLLRAKLYELEQQKQQAASQKMAEEKTAISWGHQIRSYVLQPYQMVKDLRTDVEIGNAHAVLDGAIEPFLQASLAAKVS